MAAPTSPGRRSLLRGAPRKTPVARPPYAIAESDFVDACTRCGECARACPEMILRAGDGGFPELGFDEGECTFCAACLDACPAGALQLQSMRPWPWRAVVGEGCLSARGVVCRSCGDACPTGAISFTLAHFTAASVDRAACIGCGACVAACPSSAIAMNDGSQS